MCDILLCIDYKLVDNSTRLCVILAASQKRTVACRWIQVVPRHYAGISYPAKF